MSRISSEDEWYDAIKKQLDEQYGDAWGPTDLDQVRKAARLLSQLTGPRS